MSNWAKKAVSTAMVAASITGSMPAGAALVDVFIKMEIKGESQNEAHKGEIDVMSWSWGTTGGAEPSHLAAAGVAGGRTPQITQITITKKVDVASANLLKYALTGKHMMDATLSVRKAGAKSPTDFLIIKMKDVVISAIDESGSGGNDVPTEKVTFSFASLDFSYAAQKPDGSLDMAQKMSYDVKAGKAQ
jgi:type VI secretion system secreted protein Hcp